MIFHFQAVTKGDLELRSKLLDWSLKPLDAQVRRFHELSSALLHRESFAFLVVSSGLYCKYVILSTAGCRVAFVYRLYRSKILLLAVLLTLSTHAGSGKGKGYIIRTSVFAITEWSHNGVECGLHTSSSQQSKL